MQKQPGVAKFAGDPFAQLQKILDKQQARPIRSSPTKEAPTERMSGLIMNRQKIENNAATIKRMYPDKTAESGYTWEDLIKRTSDEKIIHSKVNVSEARTFAQDTKRTTNPELNEEPEPVPQKRQGQSETLRRKQHNPNPISGEALSALDERVKNKRCWKVSLINKYENNQEGWNITTNSIVNRLKEEIHYEPTKDYAPENEYVDEKLAKKKELMTEQCRMHKENMRRNPITGDLREDSNLSKSVKRKTKQQSDNFHKSDIHHLSSRGPEEQRSHTPSIVSTRESHNKNLEIGQRGFRDHTSTPENRQGQVTPTRNRFREQYAAENSIPRSSHQSRFGDGESVAGSITSGLKH